MRTPAIAVALLVSLAPLSGCLGVTPPAGGSPSPDSTTATTTTTTAEPTTRPPTTTTATTTATPEPGDGPTVSNANATLAPGEVTTLTVRARNVGELTIREGWLADENVSIDWGNTSVEPQWEFVVETLPPYWTWETVQPEVTLHLAIQAAADAEPGTYRTTVVAWDDTNHSHEGGAEGEVVVTVAR